MSFPLVHFYAKFCVYDKQGINVLTLINIDEPNQDSEIDLDYQFQNQSTPSTTQITLHNLNDHDYKQIKTGDTIAIWAGWYDSQWIDNNVTHIFTSTINTINPETDSSGDWQMSITCEDGNKFSNETALSKIYKAKSKAIRSNASGIGQLSRQERTEIKALERKYGIRGNNIEQIKKQLAPKKKSITQGIRAVEKRKERALMNEYRTEKKGHHGRRGSGEKGYNHAIIQERKAARRRIIDDTNAQLNNIKSKFKNATNILKGRKVANNRSKKRAVRRVRTRAAAKRQRIRRKKNQQKKKSKKTSSSGLHFKKNTMASTIINKLAKIGHIKISKMKLVKNHRFTSGYTATKTPWQEIKTVAQDYCNSNIWWPHGELVIGDFAQQKSLDFTLTPDTGLTQTPTADNDDDSDDDSDISTQTMSKKQIHQQEKQNAIANPTTYQVNSVFLPFLTTGSTFRITDPSEELPTNRDGDDPIHIGELFNDEVVVQSGELSFGSGDMPTSQFDVIPKSALVKKQQQSDSEKARKAKEAARKDKKKRHRVKTKRHTRRARRVRVKHTKRIRKRV